MKQIWLLLFLIWQCAGILAQQDTYLMVLGTAQDAGYPQIGCTRECCQNAWKSPSLRAFPTSLGLVDPGSKAAWVFDATPELPRQWHHLYEESGATIAGIFLTHAHIGHYTGLIYLGREVMAANSVPVYAMPRMYEFLASNGPWDQLIELKNIDIKPLRARESIALNTSTRVTPMLVPHRDEYSEAVGYLIEGPRRKVLFIPDIDKWADWDEDIIDWIRKVDIALLDGTFFANGEIPGRDMSQIPHPFVVESLETFSVLSEADRNKIHFIHLNHTNPLWRSDAPERGRVLHQGMNIATQGQIFKL